MLSYRREDRGQTPSVGAQDRNVTLWDVTNHFFETVWDYTLTVIKYLILKSLCWRGKKGIDFMFEGGYLEVS